VSRRFVDLAHEIVSGRPGHPGLPVPRVEPWRSHLASRADYAGQAEFEITRLFLVGNTGTSIDSPYHRFPAAPDVADLPLEQVAGVPGRRIDVAGADGARSIRLPEPLGELSGMAALFRTGWDAHWGSEAYWHGAPFIGRALAARLAEVRVAIVGIDGPNVDDTDDPSRPAHTLLLGAGIPVVEHLRGLDGLPDRGFRFYAVPAPIRGAAALPVRAFAETGLPGPETDTDAG
jgi:kynurenine formamidase